MQPMVVNLRPLFLLRGEKASVADFDVEARRATRLSVLLKPGTYFLAAAAVIDAGLSLASINRAANQPAVLETSLWVLIAMAILAAGQAAWLHASADDIKAPDSNMDAEWRRALACLASGELSCWRSVDDDFDERRLRRVSCSVFSRAFAVLLLSPSGLRRWFGDRSIFASSRQSYLFDSVEWTRLNQRESSVVPIAVESDKKMTVQLPSTMVESGEIKARQDWTKHPNYADWANWLFMPEDRFLALVDRAYPVGYTTAGYCKPRLALLTANRLLTQHGPAIAIDGLTAEVRATISRFGFVDNTLTNSMLRHDLAGQPAPATKPADDWIASMLRGKYAPIAKALKDAESRLVTEGKLPKRG